MKKYPYSSRREFLKTSAAFAGFTVLPSYIALGNKSSSGIAPSEMINVAMVGNGKQGDQNRVSALNTGLCQMTAICDVHLEHPYVQPALEAHPKAARYRRFEEMFEKSGDDIDALIIATPDHAHFSVSMLAMSLGKHIYVQKPLAHTFGQCERMMKMAKKTGVATQMGNQGHSGGNYFQFKEWTEKGIVKDVTKIDAFMNRKRRWFGWGTTCTGYPEEPIPAGMDWDAWQDCVDFAPPYSSKLHPQEWRSWYNFGCGAFGDWGPHILDTCHRFLKLGYPQKVTAVKREGPNDLVFPQSSTIEFKFPERHGMPACDLTWYDGLGNKPKVDPALGYEVKGSGKILYSKDLVFTGGSHGSTLRIVPKEKFMEMRETLPRMTEKHSNHWSNFLLACKGEEETRSPFSVSGPLTQVFNLGVLAQRFGGTIEFDAKTKQITNHPEANALLDPAPRKEYEQYYNLV
ncbi:MAG: Gfo/Idh/MocA family oxidoreductase [Verrucomicrobiota bacterium]